MSERGFTLIEMLVALAASTVLMLGIFTMVEVTTRSSLRVDSRVSANQRARPVMQSLIDDLHSTCLGSGITPVLSGSDGNSISYVSYTGSAVNPTPDKHVISLSGTTLTERIYPATGGTVPSWTFSTTPSSTVQLLTRVGAGSVGGTNVPLFQYFPYTSGAIDSTPLATPLSATDAGRTAQVTVSFAASPSDTPVPDLHPSITVSDSAILRVTSPSEDTNATNSPCA